MNSPGVRSRAVRLFREVRSEYSSDWSACQSLSLKIGCLPHTLLKWVRQHAVEAGEIPGITQAERDRVKVLEREVRELRRANEILRLASAFFPQAEFARKFKP